ncbi:hypothetical protein NDU88_005351 [Pleurodeles waltl]|uniref:Uncharacterized protein n=1 Tax=Pleurodeles waltl TaxID=8319 RepID=A0AAV7MX88_PLEWA|nr:hypothetical protein NDU88_005351 [Pleurodeles waltl]
MRRCRRAKSGVKTAVLPGVCGWVCGSRALLSCKGTAWLCQSRVTEWWKCSVLRRPKVAAGCAATAELLGKLAAEPGPEGGDNAQLKDPTVAVLMPCAVLCVFWSLESPIQRPDSPQACS